MPNVAMPPEATDCHMHVFGDAAAYPPAAWRAYDPTPAALASYRGIFARLGLRRTVLVQPSAYGTDNRCMLDALAADDAGLTRGVAVIGPETSEAELRRMAALRVVGVRLNLVSNGIPAPEAAIAALRAAAEQVGPLGWHVQIYAKPALLVALAGAIPSLGVPVVVDHMGGADARLGVHQPGLDELLGLVGRGQCWVKVSGPNRVSHEPSGYRDALPIARQLISANPERVVWGSDWPHIGPHAAGAPREVVYMPIDNAGLVRFVAEAAGDAATLRRVMAENPAALYGFAA